MSLSLCPCVILSRTDSQLPCDPQNSCFDLKNKQPSKDAGGISVPKCKRPCSFLSPELPCRKLHAVLLERPNEREGLEDKREPLAFETNESRISDPLVQTAATSGWPS